MYFIAYSQGRKVCDGYGPNAEAITRLFPGKLELESTSGEEEKWSDVTAHPLMTVVYIRPEK
jgi:hypothetical protein